MMKKKTISLLLLLPVLFVLTLVSCEDDKECVPPSFKGFLYEPSPAHPGDSVTITACMRDRGQHVYGPKYTWKVTLDTLDTETGVTGTWEYKLTQKASISDPDPQVKVPIPHTALEGTTATCTFSAVYNNSVDGVPGRGVACPTLEGYLGTFQPSVVTAVLYSEANGRLTFKIAGE